MAKEFSFRLQKSLVNGLEPESNMPANAPYMSVMQNILPDERGAVYPVIFDKIHDNPSYWPYPQVFRLNEGYLVADYVSIYETDSTLEYSPLHPVDATWDAIDIVPGEGWHFARFDSAWFLTNGNTFLWRIPGYEANAYDRVVFCDTSINVSALCNHDGRLVLGGISGDWFGDTRWLEVFQHWVDTRAPGTLTHEDMAFSDDWVVWGEFGGGRASDFPYRIHLAILGFLGDSNFDLFKEMIFDAVESNEIGFVRAEGVGAIKNLSPFGSRIMVYGTNGKSELSLSDDGGYSLSGKKEIGIKNRDCVAGYEKKHAWLSSNNDLYHNQLNEGERNLKYDNHFSDNELFLVESKDYQYAVSGHKTSLEHSTGMDHSEGLLYVRRRTAGLDVITVVDKWGKQVAEYNLIPYVPEVGNGFSVIYPYIFMGQSSTVIVLKIEDDGTISFVNEFGSSVYHGGSFIAPKKFLKIGNNLYCFQESTDRVQIRPWPHGEDEGFEWHMDGVFDTFDAKYYKGYIYVTEESAKRMSKWELNGERLAYLDFPGAGLIHKLDIVDDKIYAVDQGNDRVFIYDTDFNYISEFGFSTFSDPEAPDGGFSLPSGVRYFGGEIFVHDSGRDDIQVFDLDGNFKRNISQPKAGTGANADFKGIFEYKNKLYLADSDNDVIFVLGMDLATQNIFGGSGDGSGQLDSPHDVWVGHDRVLVADKLNHRIAVFDLNGEWITSFGSLGALDSNFNQPLGVFQNKDLVYVADSQNSQIKVWDFDGANYSFSHTIGVAGGGGNDELDTPVSVFVDNGIVWVTDSGLFKVKKFLIDGTFVSQEPLELAPAGVKVFNGKRYLVVPGYPRIEVLDEDGSVSYITHPDIVHPDDVVVYHGTTYIIDNETVHAFRDPHWVASYDEREDHVWFSDGVGSYVFTQTGLGGPMTSYPSSLLYHDSRGLIGTGVLDNSPAIEIQSGLIDLNEPGFKHVNMVYFEGEGMTSPMSYMRYSESTLGSLSYTLRNGIMKPVNGEGVSFLNTSFRRGKLVLSASGGVGGQAGLYMIEVRYVNEDRTYRRGAKASIEQR